MRQALTVIEVGAFLEAFLSKIVVAKKREAQAHGRSYNPNKKGELKKSDVIGMTCAALSYAWQNTFCARYPTAPRDFGRAWNAKTKRFDEEGGGEDDKKPTQADQEWNHLSAQLYITDLSHASSQASKYGWELTPVQLADFIRITFFDLEDARGAEHYLMQAKNLFLKMTDEQILKQMDRTREFFNSKLRLDVQVPKGKGREISSL